MAVSPENADLAEGVRAILVTAVDPRLTIADIRQLTGGASRETWSIDISRPDRAPTQVILRRDPPGHGEPDRMRAEVACLNAAKQAHVPVPTVLASGDTAAGIDAPYILMEKISGEALPKKIQRDPEFDDIRSNLAEQMGHVIGQIHQSDLQYLGQLDTSDPVDAIEQVYKAFDEPRPAVEIGLHWLRHNPPEARPQALVHGDFRLGNLLIDHAGINAVLDWELAHLGNPIEDLGWLCVRSWRFGSAAPVAGIGSREQLLDGYERATDTRPSQAELHWWEVFGTLKWLVLSRHQAERYYSGAEDSIELAAIGRRVCESEYDLLLILDYLGLAGVDNPPTETDHTLHDRPQAAEAIDLVSDLLKKQIMPALAPDRQREGYLLRVAANMLQIAGREIRAGDTAQHTVSDMLTGLGCRSEAELAQRIRQGELSPYGSDIQQVVTTAVLNRIRTANPRHMMA